MSTAEPRPDALPALGALHDLERLVRTHLFVISPNNSGSTFLKNVLATSRHTWNLPSEGQHMPGFGGPSGINQHVPLLWAAEPERLARFQAPGAYDWEQSRKVWYFQAFARDPQASVFVEKSPTFLLKVAELAAHFRDARFLFLVRDPYPVIEGIVRRYRKPWKRRRELPKEPNLVVAAARHVAACLELQRENVARFSDRGTFFTYETMCAEPERVQAQIQALVPALDDLVLDQRVAVKGMYDEPLRDMNAEQVARLSAQDLRDANRVLAEHRALLTHFGYGLRDA